MFGFVSFTLLPDSALRAKLTSLQGRKTRDIITLFHKQSNPSSVRVHNALKMLSAQASETATGDQASDHSAHQKLQRTEFDLEVTEADPTPDQLSIVLDYVGPSRIGEFVKGASTKDEAMKRLKEFTKPTVSFESGCDLCDPCLTT